VKDTTNTMGPKLRRRTATAGLAALALAGCTDGSGGGNDASDGGGKGSGSDGKDDAQPSAEEVAAQKVETAKRQLAQHDPDAAEKTLKDQEGDDVDDLRTKIDKTRDELVEWPDNLQISHLFFHSLIADTDRAFDGDEDAQGYDDYMCTVDEFTKILKDVYDDGYVLVSPHDICRKHEDGTMRSRKIHLPKDRKPMVLSQDDVCYYEYMEGDGFADDLHVSDDGKIVNSYTDGDGKTTEGSYDIVPLVDDFLDEHPDFSYHGHKGIVALTGYNGILGYRSSEREYGDDPKKLKKAQDKAKKTAKALKEDGWEIASHSWGHIDVGKSPVEKIRTDFDRWDNEVKPLTGETDMLILPFGADMSGVPPYDTNDPKYRTTRDHGFDYIFLVDGTAEYWAQMQDGYLRQARMNVDGIRLRGNASGEEKSLEPFFDSSSVIDHSRPGL
jgi:hypothetical protein